MRADVIETDVAIVGGGLSGLYTASLLSRAGRDCVVLEARERTGGRILSVEAARTQGASFTSVARYDLGPAWFWPDMQPRMRQMVAELGLIAFPQESTGAVLVERAPGRPAERYHQGFSSEPRSMRLVGGMQSLSDALALSLPTECAHLGTRVNDIEVIAPGRIRIAARHPGGLLEVIADSVVLAMPPRLAANTIRFSPTLPGSLHRHLADIPTWMAGHAKVLAVYDRPFWLEHELSGTATSFVGPLMEIHDASAPNGHPALFGFVGVPALVRRSMGSEALQSAALAQLARLFGSEAERPESVFVTDWSLDPCTATSADAAPLSAHPVYGPAPTFGEPWAGSLVFAGTEVAPTFGGYLEGALEAASTAAESLRRPR